MPTVWNAHRFSGGPLALCAANAVIHRADPLLRFDRFDEAGETARFAEAASRFCAAEFPGQVIADADRQSVKSVREAVDALFRGGVAAGGLAHFLAEAARSIGSAMHAGPGLLPLDAAISHSALALYYSRRSGRVRICPNCGWLFADESRNGARRWCDMAVCGNRAKARRHYQKRELATCG